MTIEGLCCVIREGLVASLGTLISYSLISCNFVLIVIRVSSDIIGSEAVLFLFCIPLSSSYIDEDMVD